MFLKSGRLYLVLFAGLIFASSNGQARGEMPGDDSTDSSLTSALSHGGGGGGAPPAPPAPRPNPPPHPNPNPPPHPNPNPPPHPNPNPPPHPNPNPPPHPNPNPPPHPHPHPPHPIPPNQVYTEIECDSTDGGDYVCPVGFDIEEVVLLQEYSDTPGICQPGVTYAGNVDSVEVTGGCQGYFGVYGDEF